MAEKTINKETTNETQEKIKKMCEEKLCLSKTKLGKEYYYNSIVFCLIDAVFSIGVRYSCVKKTVENYCNYFKLEMYHDEISCPTDTHTIKNFIENMKNLEDYGRETVYKNRQRTSARNGIPKAEAVYLIAEELQKLKINSIHDLRDYKDLENLKKSFTSVQGQGSGISFSYFLMLAGDDCYMKIDRWIERFVEEATGGKLENISENLIEVCKGLKGKYPELTPRLLDYAIWSYSKNASSPKKKKTNGC